ncbi:hypothetical protein BHYA_0025g00250 [Botrytis hyacinthi]|uniref:Uncharacterized protein n=1 Tax=Botrytis hyacinthi TaxID=278943 RepID=A0A4Z1GXA8_9HELO|nr:hypothetical protein BHYA_0025g00250 [Botrytis hyacinthi]
MFFNNAANRANPRLPPLPPLPPVFGLDGFEIEIPEIPETTLGSGRSWFGWGSNNYAIVSKSMATLQNRNTNLRRENGRLRNLGESWQREVERLRNQDARLDRQDERQNQIIEELRGQLAELRRRDEQHTQTIQGLREQVEGLGETDQTIDDLRIQISELRREDALHAQTIRDLRDQVAKAGEKDQTIEELGIQLSEVKRENNSHTQTIQALREEIAKLLDNSSANELRTQITTLSETIDQKVHIIQNLHKQISILTEQHSKQVTELRERITTVSKENDERVNIMSELRVKLTEENEKHMKQEWTISSLRNKLNNEAEMCEVRRAWAERQHETAMEKVQYELGEVRAQMATLELRVKKSEEERDEARKAVKMANVGFEEVVERSRALEATNESLEGRLMRFKREEETSAEAAKQEGVYEEEIRVLKEELRIVKMAGAHKPAEGM